MTVYLSNAAFRDLESIRDFIASDSLQRANSYLLKLQERINNLSHQPLSGRRRDELTDGLFSFPIDNYVVFYKIKSKNSIYVSRILHSARDSTILLH